MWLSKHKIFAFMVGLAAFIALLLLGVQTQQFGPQTQPTVRQFPTQQLSTLIKQQPATAQDLFQQEYQIVNVWASWCGICRTEHQFLHQLAEQGVPIVGLNYRDQRPQALRYLADLGNPYQTVIYDPKGSLSIDLGVIGTPETYLVNRNGNIVYKYSGLLDEKAWKAFFAHYFASVG